MVSSSFLCQKIRENNLKSLYGILDSGELSDYTLKTKDESCIKTHKFILRSSSLFFDKLFNNNFKDSNEDHLVLENVSFCVLNKIVKYLYSGAIEIEEELAQEILDIALFLQLIELVDKCTDILCESVNENNCFDLLKYSKTYNQSDKLKSKCFLFILQNLNVLIDHQEFVKIALDDIKSLFATEITEFKRNEEEIYLATEKWLIHDLEYREQFIHDLIDGINFENISRQFALTRILESNPLMENKYFLQNIVKIMKTDWSKVERNIISDPKAKTLYAIIEDEILSFSCEDMKFSKIVSRLPEKLTRFGSCTFGSKNIFICGGDIIDRNDFTIYKNTCKYYSIEKNEWKTLPSMEVPRTGNRSVTLNDKIYACGGFNEKTVEIFDIGKSIWSRGPSLNNAMVNVTIPINIGLFRYYNLFGLCSTNNCIYALNEKYFQFLDVRENVWKDLSVHSNMSITIESAIANDSFVFGVHCDGFSSFDIRKKCWMDSDIKFNEKFWYCPASCISNNKMFVFNKNYNFDECTHMLLTYNLNDLSCERSCSMDLHTNENCYDLFSI